MIIRDATDADMAGVMAIYNDAVAHTTAVWNNTQVDLANRQAWLAERRRAGYPVLVALGDDGRVLGYASFGDWRAFGGYRHTVEHSVYVRADTRGAGIGRALCASSARCSTSAAAIPPGAMRRATRCPALSTRSTTTRAAR